MDSYSGQRGMNKFTKVRMDADADETLRAYFLQHGAEIENWFNIISPADGTLGSLQTDLGILSNRS